MQADRHNQRAHHLSVRRQVADIRQRGADAPEKSLEVLAH